MKITVPNSISEITVAQYMKYQRVLQLENIDEDVQLVAIVSCFCDLSVDETIKIPYKDLKEIANIIINALQENPKDIQIYKDYGRIPNLDDITAGEYIDMDKFFSDNNTLHKALAVLFRPIKNKSNGMYNIEPYKNTKHADDLLNAPVELLLSSQVFFWNLGIDLLKAIKEFLANPKTKEQEDLVRALEQNGDGINHYIQSLEGAFSILEEQLKPTFTSF